MSRIGNTPIPISDKLKISMNGDMIEVTGPKGALNQNIPDGITIQQKDGQLLVCRKNDSRRSKSLHGLMRSLLFNMAKGVDSGFQKELQIQGVGYRAQVKGNSLVLNIGFSHPVEFMIPDGITISVNDNTKILVEGIDKQRVGQTAATIRAFRKPEPYKGKGIRYVDEFIQLKEGKTV